MLVEYDNTEPNHTHTVWHNPRDHFGEDLLRRHHETVHSIAFQRGPKSF